MIDDVDRLVRSLNSPADWAVVGAAGLAGFVLDAAINIVPLPVFSPGVCGITAAGTALTAKRAWEATRLARRQARYLELLVGEARRQQQRLAATGRAPIAEQLDFEVEAAVIRGDTTALEAAISHARSLP